MKKSVILPLMAAALLSGAASCCSGDKGTACSVADSTATSDAAIENIMSRASVREFTDQAVSKDTLDKLVRAGMAAPSAMDKRPWEFVVVTERPVLDSLGIYQSAQAAIVVCGNLNDYLEGPGEQNWLLDCSAVSENILLAVNAYGLGAVWCGVYPGEARVADVSRVLSLPEKIVPLNILAIGYPAAEPQPKDKWDAAKVHYQKW